MSNFGKKTAVCLLLLCVCFLGAVIYLPSFNVPFIYDDIPYIVENLNIRYLDDIPLILKANSQPTRFIPFYTFAMNYHVHHFRVFGYHLVNLIIHLLNGILVFWLMNLLCGLPKFEDRRFYKYRHFLVLCVALVFLSHPLQTQAVTYIFQRVASLAAMFYLLSVCLYIKGRLAASGVWRNTYFGIAGLTALCGMLSKEITFTLPLTVLMIEGMFFQSGQGWKSRSTKWNIITVLMFLLIIPALMRFNFGHIFASTLSGSHDGDVITPLNYLLTQFRVLLTYLKLFIVPIGQNLDYDFALSHSLLERDTLVSFLCLAGIGLFGIRNRKTYPFIAFGIFWFFICMAVESSLIPIRHVIFEHRTYLPSVGLCAVLCVGLFHLIKEPRKYFITLSIIILTLSYLTYERNQVWTDRVGFWKDVVRKSPHKARGYINLGVAYIIDEKYDQAIKEFDKALALRPDHFKIYLNRGNALLHNGAYELAIEDYNKVLELRPSEPRAFNNRGMAYKAQGEIEQALSDFHQAIKLRRTYFTAYYNRGNIYQQLGQTDEAIKDFTRCIMLAPQYANAYFGRGQQHSQKGNYDAALKDFNRAITLGIRNLDVFNNRSIIYGLMGRQELALADLNLVLKSRPNSAEAYANRGVTYVKTGRYDLALKDYSKAIELRPDYPAAYYNRGGIYKMLGMLEMASKDFSSTVQNNPNHVQAYFQRAHIYLLQEELEKAQGDYLKILSILPQNARAHNALGKIEFSINNLKEAVKYFNRALELDPDYAQAYFFRSHTYKALGKYDLALENILKAIALGHIFEQAYVEDLQMKVQGKIPDK